MTEETMYHLTKALGEQLPVSGYEALNSAANEFAATMCEHADKQARNSTNMFRKEVDESNMDARDFYVMMMERTIDKIKDEVKMAKTKLVRIDESSE